MSLQTIIDHAESISIDHRSVVATTVTRSQKILTAARSTVRPWQFKVTPSNAYRWDLSYNRGVVAAIENIDRHTSTVITLSNAAGMAWLVEYQGVLSAGQRSDMTINSMTGTTLVLNLGSTVQALSNSTVLFRAGDIIQPANSAYPYKVVNDVTRGSGVTRTITLHRGTIPETGVTLAGQTLNIGVDVDWRVKIVALPSVTITPGRFIQWTGDFELVEEVI